MSSRRRIEITGDVLVSNLLTGRLFPNLFVAFLALGLIPRARLLGGHRQISYYPRFAKLARIALGDTGLPKRADTGWVLGPLDLKEHPLDLLRDPSGLLARFADIPLSVTMGNVPLLDEDKSWARVMLASGGIV